MRIFRPIIEPMPNLLAIDVADLAHRRGIGGKPVGDDALRSAIFLHDPLQKPQRRSLLPLRGDHGFQDLALVIDGPPEIAGLAVDLRKEVSGAEEFGRRALSEPDVILSYHPAPLFGRFHRAGWLCQNNRGRLGVARHTRPQTAIYAPSARHSANAAEQTAPYRGRTG